MFSVTVTKKFNDGKKPVRVNTNLLDLEEVRKQCKKLEEYRENHAREPLKGWTAPCC